MPIRDEQLQGRVEAGESLVARVDKVDPLLRQQVEADVRAPEESVPDSNALFTPSNNVNSVSDQIPGLQATADSIQVPEINDAAFARLGPFMEYVRANKNLGETQMAQAALANEVLFGGKTFESVQPQLEVLDAIGEKNNKQSQALKAHITKFAAPLSFPLDAMGFASQSFPLSVDIMAGGVTTGGATLAIAAPTIAASGGLTAPSAIIAGEMGFQSGVFAESMRVNAALAYIDYRKVGFTHQEARDLAITAGVINGALDAIGIGLILGVAKKPLVKLLQSASIKAFATSAVGSLFVASAIEGTQEMLQDLVNKGLQIAGALFANDIRKLPTAREVLTSAALNFYAGAGAGTVVGGTVHLGGLSLTAAGKLYEAKVLVEAGDITISGVIQKQLDSALTELEEMAGRLADPVVADLNKIQIRLRGLVSQIGNAIQSHNNLAMASGPGGQLAPNVSGSGRGSGSGSGANNTGAKPSADGVFVQAVDKLNEVIKMLLGGIERFYKEVKTFDNLEEAEKTRIKTDLTAMIEQKLHQTPLIGTVTKAMRVAQMLLEGYLNKKLDESQAPVPGDVSLSAYGEVFVPASEMTPDQYEGARDQHRKMSDQISQQAELYQATVIDTIQAGPHAVDLSQTKPDPGSLTSTAGKVLLPDDGIPKITLDGFEPSAPPSKGILEKTVANLSNLFVTGQFNLRGTIGQVLQDAELGAIEKFEELREMFDLNKFYQLFTANKRVAFQHFFDEVQEAMGLPYHEVVNYIADLETGRNVTFNYVGVKVTDPITGDHTPVRPGRSLADVGLVERQESISKNELLEVYANLEMEGELARSITRSNGFTTPGILAEEGETLRPGQKTYLEAAALQLSEQDKAFIKGVRNFFEKYYPRIAGAVRLFDGVELGFVPGYVGQVVRGNLNPMDTFDPEKMKEEGLESSGGVEDLLLGPFLNEGVNVRNNNVFAKAEPNFTLAREPLTTRIYKPQGIVSGFTRYIEESERYIAYRAISRAMFSAVNSPQVRKVVESRFGTAGPNTFSSVYKALTTHMAAVFLGRNKALKKDSVQQIEESLVHALGVALIGGNVFSALKQRASVPNVLHFIGVKDAIKQNAAYNERLKELQGMWQAYPPFINRASNFADSQIALGITKNAQLLKEQALTDIYFSAVREGDRAASFRVASIVYLDYLEKNNYYGEDGKPNTELSEAELATINSDAKWRGFDAANSTQSTSDIDLRSGISLQYPALAFAQQQPQALGQRTYEAFRQYLKVRTKENLVHAIRTLVISNVAQAAFNAVNVAYAMVVFGDGSDEYNRARDSAILSGVAGPSVGVYNALMPFIAAALLVNELPDAKPFDVIPVTGQSVQRAINSMEKVVSEAIAGEAFKIDLLEAAESFFKAGLPVLKATPVGKYLPPIAGGAAISAIGDAQKALEKEKKKAEAQYKRDAKAILESLDNLVDGLFK